MFWGLIMEPGRRYTQRVEKSFHVSMASLDVGTSNNEAFQVMLGYKGRNYLLCTLQKPNLLQCPLDLEFKEGSEVSFATNGKGHVHLTGYLTDEFDVDGFGDEDIEEEEEDVEEDEEVSNKGKKRAGKALENGQPAKRTKDMPSSSGQLDFSSDTDEEGVEEENDTDEVEEEEGDDDAEENEAEEEEDEDEDDEGEEDSDDDDDEEEDEEEEDEEETEVKESPTKAKGKKQQEVSATMTNGVAKKEIKKNQQDQKSAEGPKKGGKKTLQGGVIVEDIQEGQGQAAKNGKFVNVFYEGRLKSNNKMFDSLKKGAGFNFRLGTGEVIKGWDVGIAGMRPGGKRRITCPPNMAYGPRGSPPTIPPNSTLVFEVEMRKIR